MDKKIERMRYSRYKQHYADCATVPGTYDKISKTVEVIIPDGREKPSGVRHQKFHTYCLHFVSNGERCHCIYKAVCLGNAVKQHLATCKREGWTPDRDELLSSAAMA